MTTDAQSGHSARRPGALAIHSLNTFNLTVPDLEEARQFYDSFGLDVREEGNALGLYAHGNPHRYGVLTEGKHKRLSHLSFGVYEDDLEPFRKHLEAKKVTFVDPLPGAESNGIWFLDHDGTPTEICVREKSMPDEKSSFEAISSPAGVRGVLGRSQAEVVRPRRLSHVLKFTSNVQKAIDFYSGVLGLRLSDRSGDGIAFMHGAHGSDHHLVAFALSEGPGFHHCAWDVSSVDEVGRGWMQMAGKGYTRGWGLGRHVLGSNYFYYCRDPWGSYSEYSADIDYVGATQEWDGGDYPDEDSIYMWGPDLFEDFIYNYELDNAG